MEKATAPFQLRPGEWNGETSMVLCLGESLFSCGGTDLSGQTERYCR